MVASSVRPSEHHVTIKQLCADFVGHPGKQVFWASPLIGLTGAILPGKHMLRAELITV
jgi:hypothetical protein